MNKNKNFLRLLKTRPDGFPLIDNDDEFTYDDYLEWCELNGRAPAPEGSGEHYRWEAGQKAIHYEDDRANCRSSKTLCGARFLLTGTLGLWDGKHRIRPVIFGDFDEMVDAILSGGGIITIRATYDTDGIHFRARHHDGTNVFDAFILKEDADKDVLRRRMTKEGFCPYSGYDKRFFQKITDYLY